MSSSSRSLAAPCRTTSPGSTTPASTHQAHHGFSTAAARRTSRPTCSAASSTITRRSRGGNSLVVHAHARSAAALHGQFTGSISLGDSCAGLRISKSSTACDRGSHYTTSRLTRPSSPPRASQRPRAHATRSARASVLMPPGRRTRSRVLGQARPPARHCGGLGVFSNASSAGSIGAALDNTGLPSGTQQIVCTVPRFRGRMDL